MRVLIRGAGDIATGIALRLCRARLQVVMTDLASPTAIRRTVCFSQAIVYGTTAVEGIYAVYAKDCAEAERIMAQGDIPVLADPDCFCRTYYGFITRILQSQCRYYQFIERLLHGHHCMCFHLRYAVGFHNSQDRIH